MQITETKLALFVILISVIILLFFTAILYSISGLELKTFLLKL